MFTTKTTVDFSQSTANDQTVLELRAADRPGLLSGIGQVFIEQGIDIEAAKIVTIGERAEDVFYVCLESGGGALDDEQQQQLGEALLEHLDSGDQQHLRARTCRNWNRLSKTLSRTGRRVSTDRAQVEAAVQEAIGLLDSGAARVAEKKDGDWHVNQWLKKAVLLSFALTDNKVIESGHSRFYDKVPMKYADYSEEQFRADGVRVVPDAIVRKGAYVAPGRCADAELREHRRLRRQQHDG